MPSFDRLLEEALDRFLYDKRQEGTAAPQYTSDTPQSITGRPSDALSRTLLGDPSTRKLLSKKDWELLESLDDSSGAGRDAESLRTLLLLLMVLNAQRRGERASHQQFRSPHVADTQEGTIVDVTPQTRTLRGHYFEDASLNPEPLPPLSPEDQEMDQWRVIDKLKTRSASDIREENQKALAKVNEHLGNVGENYARRDTLERERAQILRENAALDTLESMRKNQASMLQRWLNTSLRLFSTPEYLEYPKQSIKSCASAMKYAPPNWEPEDLFIEPGIHNVRETAGAMVQAHRQRLKEYLTTLPVGATVTLQPGGNSTVTHDRYLPVTSPSGPETITKIDDTYITDADNKKTVDEVNKWYETRVKIAHEALTGSNFRVDEHLNIICNGISATHLEQLATQPPLSATGYGGKTMKIMNYISRGGQFRHFRQEQAVYLSDLAHTLQIEKIGDTYVGIHPNARFVPDADSGSYRVEFIDSVH